ncbi:hypothetical protein Tco_1037965 [Tanacetum coccineum]
MVGMVGGGAVGGEIGGGGLAWKGWGAGGRVAEVGQESMGEGCARVGSLGEWCVEWLELGLYMGGVVGSWPCLCWVVVRTAEDGGGGGGVGEGYGLA